MNNLETEISRGDFVKKSVRDSKKNISRSFVSKGI